jgi:hypothetical protein
MALGAAAIPGAIPRPAWQQLAWVAAFAVCAFADAALFAGALDLPRRAFVAAHATLTVALAWAYLRWNGVGVRRLIARKWKAGVAWGLAFSAVMLIKVVADPVSASATGWRLVVDLAWSGVVYGVADAVLLAVLPVIAVSRAFAAAGRSHGRGNWMVMRIVAIVASLLITLTYHYGFPEYRNGVADLGGAVFGNGVMTVGYLASGSVLTPVLSHAVIHCAVVLRGPATSALLPPHEGR